MSQLMRKSSALSLARHSAIAAAVGLLVASGSVHAQSTTNGTVYGTISASAGSTLLLENLGTGAKRTLTLDSNGSFQATALPPGRYKATLSSGGKVVSTEQIEVFAGQGSELKFSASNVLQTVEVVGRRKTIDVSRSNGGATFSAQEIARLPVRQDVASVVQLAPNTTQADFRYGKNAASFGGSGSSENAVYINGFTATNGLFQVGYSSLPFGSIAQTNVITGGYGAEFGRSTGGVINIVTKSGSNEFEVGGGFSFAPDSLRSKPRNIMYPNTGAPRNAATDGQVFYYREGDKRDEQVYNLYASGPIIKDKLFFYVAAEMGTNKQETARSASSSTSAGTNGWLKETTKVPRSFLKLDWNITDDHKVEFTGIRDKTKVDAKYYGLDYKTLQPNNIQNGGATFVNYNAGVPFLSATGAAMAAGQGADMNIIKYTGYLTDDLTVQALVGTSKTVRNQTPVGYIPGLYPIAAAEAARAPGINYTPTQVQGFTSNLLRDDAYDKNKGFRLDVEYKLNAQHTLRAGLDSNHIKATNGSSAAGGGGYTYLRTDKPGEILAGMDKAPNSTGSPLGALGYYVNETHYVDGATPQVRQAAQYIEDRYQVTKNLLVTVGLRNEQFRNTNSDDKTIVEKTRQLAPRLSTAWDVYGDSSFKIFGTAGRYHLQIPANLAVRFAGGSLNTSNFYTYTGVDPATGAPIGKVALGGVYSPNNELGVPPDPRGIAATDIKSNTQDEFTLGFEKALTPDWVGGMRINVRKLVSSIDDVSDTRPISAILAKTSQAEADYFAGHWNGALFNPGRTNTFLVPVDAKGTLREVTVPWSAWGFPEGVKRNYLALDFSLEHPMKNGWYGKVNYTWSRSRGNTEGQQKSDNGQADVSFTSVWDFPDLMLNSNGPLPNMRKHQIKAFGVYEFSDQISVSGNALIASGRPRSCTANLPPEQDSAGIGGYGSIFFVCPGAVGRGGLGWLPWETRLDAALMYRPSFIKGLTLKAEVFNIFNKQTVTAVNEALNVANQGTAVSPTSQMEQNYTMPRAVQFSAQYSHKF